MHNIHVHVSLSQMIEYLESCNVKYTIVHTKCDVAGTPKRLAQVTGPYTWLGLRLGLAPGKGDWPLHFARSARAIRTPYHARRVQSACTLCMCAACALHVRCMCAACALHVRCR